jgi:hypothetical protein
MGVLPSVDATEKNNKRWIDGVQNVTLKTISSPSNSITQNQLGDQI